MPRTIPPDQQQVICEFLLRDMPDGDLWVDIQVDRTILGSMGPYSTDAERQAAIDEAIEGGRAFGMVEIPTHTN